MKIILIVILIQFNLNESYVNRMENVSTDIHVRKLIVNTNETIGNVGEILLKKNLLNDVKIINKYKLLFYSSNMLSKKVSSSSSSSTTTSKESIFHVDSITGDINLVAIPLNDNNATNALEYLCKKRSLCTCDKCVFSLNILYSTTNKMNVDVIRVLVDDVNQHAPKFVQPLILINISENTPIGESVIVRDVGATDEDIFYNQLSYSMKSDVFNVTSIDNGKSLILTILSELDYEKRQKYEFNLNVIDNGGLRASASMIVQLIDQNDNSPKCLSNLYQVSIRENTIESNILQILTHDADSGLNGQVEYTLRYNEYFHIDRSTGWLSSIKPFDYETQQVYQFEVRISDLGEDMEKIGFCKVKINIIDENDNKASLVMSTPLPLIIQENNEPFKIIAQLSVHDLDSLQGTYELSVSNVNVFKLVPTQERVFDLIVLKSLDYEETQEIPFEITLKDGSNYVDTLSSQVKLIDLNDNSPKFTQNEYLFVINEELDETRVGPIEYFDGDTSFKCNYTFKQTPVFVKIEQEFLNANNRVWLNLHRKFDYEIDGDEFYFDLTLVDCDPNFYDKTRIRLKISNLNDNPPEFLSSQNSTLLLNENSPIGTLIATIQVQDKDALDEQIQLDFVSNKTRDLFELRGNFLYSRVIFDAEVTSDGIDVELEAKDGELKAFKLFKIHINDLNDNRPLFIYPKETTKYMSLKSNSSELFIAKSHDNDASSSKLTYYINDSLNILEINSQSGQVTTRTLDKTIHTQVYLSVSDGLYETQVNFSLYLNYDSYDLPYDVLTLIKNDLLDHDNDEVTIDRNLTQIVSNSVLIVILLVVLTFMILIAVFILVHVYRRLYARRVKSSSSSSPVDLMKTCLKRNHVEIRKAVPVSLMVKDAPQECTSDTYETPRMDLDTVYNLSLRKISKAIKEPSAIVAAGNSLNSTLSQNSSSNNTILTQASSSNASSSPYYNLNQHSSDTNINSYFKRFERIYNTQHSGQHQLNDTADPSKTYIHLNFSQF